MDTALVRKWLTNLGHPERLADPEMRALLRAHGHPATGSPIDVGRAAMRLLEDAVDALASGPGAPAGGPLPHRVLTTCFVERTKNRAAAARLGMSERQLSRERSRAVELVAAQLRAPLRRPAAAPPALPRPLLARPGLEAELEEAVRSRGFVRVGGAPGCGKTVLVAAHAERRARVFWHDGGAGLAAVLFELGEHLAPEDPALATYLRGSLPRPDLGLAARIALAGLAGRDRLLVFDDPAPAVRPFVSAIVVRVPDARVVEIGRGHADVDVPAFTLAETAALVDMHGAGAGRQVAAVLHSWTGGNPGLVAGAAHRLATRPPRTNEVLGGRALLLTNLRGLTRAARRAA